MNKVSTIVPSCDEASVLPHCLERLQRIGEQLAVPCELPFVDDGSRDGGAECMKALLPGSAWRAG